MTIPHLASGQTPFDLLLVVCAVLRGATTATTLGLAFALGYMITGSP